MEKIQYLKLAKELTGLTDIAELIKTAEQLSAYLKSDTIITDASLLKKEYNPIKTEDDYFFAQKANTELEDDEWIRQVTSKMCGEDLVVKDEVELKYDRETALCSTKDYKGDWPRARDEARRKEAMWYKDMTLQIEQNEELYKPLVTVYKNGWEQSPINSYQEQYFNFVDKHQVSVIKTDRQIGSTTANIYSAIKFAMAKKDSTVYYFCQNYSCLQHIKQILENSGDAIQVLSLSETDGVLDIVLQNLSSIFITTCKNPLFTSPSLAHQRLMLIVEDMAFIPRTLEASYLGWINFAIQSNAKVILQSDSSSDGKGLFNNIWNDSVARPFNDIIINVASKLELKKKIEEPENIS